jgi:coenzyme F420-reducing hydrogenase alpha subunit
VENPEDIHQKTFKVNGITTPFNKKELRWLKDQLEDCIEWGDDTTTRSNRINYEKMLEKVNERLDLL